MLLETLAGWSEKAALIAALVVVAVIIRVIVIFAIKRVIAHLIERAPQESQTGTGISSRAINALRHASGLAAERRRQRLGTLRDLLRNIIDVVIVTLVVLTILSILGIPTAPLLASAGVGGVALGFGAQSLVKDYLSGIFMLAEDQFGVGDIITVDEVTGEVLEVTLRVTKIQTFDGVIWYVRNGEVLRLGNITQGSSTSFIELPVAIDEDPERVITVVKSVVAGMAQEPDFVEVLLDDPVVLGVDALAAGTMTIKVMVKATANQQWEAIREVRRRAAAAFAQHGIRPPILPGQ